MNGIFMCEPRIDAGGKLRNFLCGLGFGLNFII
uniref:Uncharacterized protein n=1 Tax=Rhizophora mucronata TaxID=61149 RepID=A0A2P2N2H3_RHIMU